jgi:hypothetical protein
MYNGDARILELAKYSPVKNVRYVSWEDAFDVEFDDGLCILEAHSTICAANEISPGAKLDRLGIEDWTPRGSSRHFSSDWRNDGTANSTRWKK